MNNGRKWPPQPQHRPGQRPAQPHRPNVLQPKAAALLVRKTPTAPPVYRPQPAPRCLQPKAATPQQPPSPGRINAAAPPPPVYRPQPTPKVLQRKPAVTSHPPLSVRAKQKPPVPPASRPQSATIILSPKRAHGSPDANPYLGSNVKASNPSAPQIVQPMFKRFYQPAIERFYSTMVKGYYQPVIKRFYSTVIEKNINWFKDKTLSQIANILRKNNKPKFLENLLRIDLRDRPEAHFGIGKKNNSYYLDANETKHDRGYKMTKEDWELLEKLREVYRNTFKPKKE
jgi:hypothetical protein